MGRGKERERGKGEKTMSVLREAATKMYSSFDKLRKS